MAEVSGDVGGDVAKVIVVDDELELLDILCEVLRDDGHEVRGACNAEEALLLYRDEPAEVIVSDVVMPHFAVDHLLKGLQEMEAHPFLVILTAAEDVLLEPYREYPILRKPFEYLNLRAKVRELLQGFETGFVLSAK